MPTKGSKLHFFLFALVVFASSCSYDFNNVPEGAQIICKTNADCPGGMVCSTTVGICVKEIDPNPPDFASTPKLSAGYLKKGDTATLRFEVNKDLFAVPEVILKQGSTVQSFTFDESGSSGRTYVFTYTATGNEPEFADHAVLVNMTDKSGNRADGKNAGTIQFQFHAPVIDQPTLLLMGSPVKNGGAVKVSFTLNRAVATDPVVSLEGGRTFTKESSSGGLSFVYSYTASTADTADGTQVEKTLNIEATDEAGNRLSQVLEKKVYFDFIKPALSGAVTATPERTTKGGYVNVTFTVTEDLGADPAVTIGGEAMVKEGKAGKTYTYSRRVTDTDTAGEKTVAVSLSDLAGNTADNLPGPPVTYDFTGPGVTNPSLAPGWKLRANVDFELAFDVDKPLASDPEITISNSLDPNIPLTRSATCAKTYCFTGKTPVSGQAMFYSVNIKATDRAGNFTTVNAGTIEIDNVAPKLAGFEVSPKTAKAGTNVTVVLSADEALAAAPTVVAYNTADATKKLAFICLDAAKQQTSYAYSATVVPGTVDGDYKFETFKLKDVAENESAEITRTDKLDIRATVPTIVEGPTLNKAPAYFKAGDKVTVSFKTNVSLDDSLPKARLAVKRNGQYLPQTTCVKTTGVEKGYDCTVADALDGTELPQGINGIAIELADIAGNTSYASTSLTMDFDAPDIAAGAYSNLISNFPENPIINVTALTNGTTVVANFSLSEELAADSPAPYIVICKSSGCDPKTPSQVIALDPDQSGSTGKTYRFTKKVTTLDPNLDFTSNLYLVPGLDGGIRDLAGNEQTGAVQISTVKVNTTQPGAPSIANVYYRRVPWGERDANKNFVEKSFTVLCNACQFSPLVEKILIYDSATASSSGLIGEFQNLHKGGAFGFDPIELNGSDRAHVYMAVADSAGNVSPAVEIKDAEWVATMGYKVPGSTIENPNVFLTNGLFNKTLGQSGFVYEPAVFVETPPHQLQVDQIGNPNPGWVERFDDDNDMPSDRTGTAMAYDGVRGKVVLFGGETDLITSNDETWERDGVTWVRLNPSIKPSARSGHAMSYDSARGKVVLFGGNAPSRNNETWEWDGVTWTQLNPATKPSARSRHAMAYDSARGNVVLFGGGNNETWKWDGVTWTKLNPSIKPPARSGHAMAYDTERGKVVQFGGGNNETWEWDGVKWTQPNPVTKPPARYDHAMAYDSAHGKMIMFGGEYLASAGSEWKLFDDTWEWDGVTWVQWNLSTKVYSRNNHAMAYDSARRKVVLFGGGSGVMTTYDETREWDGMTWTQLNPATKPSARQGHAMTYDSVHGKVVLFGGSKNGGSANNETWEWDGVNWTQLNPATKPSARSGHAMVYDSARGKVLLFGGGSGGNETWEWDGVNWTQLNPVTKPSARSGHAMVYDSAREKVVLFGGSGLGGTETWEWDGTTWVQLDPLTKPSARYDHAMAFDIVRGKVVLFGGMETNYARPNDETWEWDGVTWVQLNPLYKPSARSGHAMVYDIARGMVVLFGEATSIVISNDSETWEWDGVTWVQWKPVTKPSVRIDHAMAYDSARGKVLMFGGAYRLYSGGNILVDDTWEWDGVNWTQLNPATKPSARSGHAMAYDSARGKMVLFGGNTSVTTTTPNDETWEWDGVNWTQLNPATKPSARSGHAMAYDNARGKVVMLWGGDMWEWDGVTWTQLNPATKPSGSGRAMAYDSVREKMVVLFDGQTWEWDGINWTQLNPATKPSGSGQAMAYDSVRGKVVMFDNQTWEWDGINWTQLNPAAKPSSRSKSTMVYDSLRGKMVLFGGDDNYIVALNDTWEWDGQGNGRAGHVVNLAIKSTGVFKDDIKPDVQQVAVTFVSGGIGYPQGVVTNGVNLMAWYDNQWNSLASGSDGPKTRGLVNWTTTDAVMIQKLLNSYRTTFNFAVVPQAPNGFGHPDCPSDWTAEECAMGMVSTEYVEVTLKYTLP